MVLTDHKKTHKPVVEKGLQNSLFLVYSIQTTRKQKDQMFFLIKSFLEVKSGKKKYTSNVMF